MLDLVRDVLDKQLLDREGRPFGKVDGVILDVRADGRPRVMALEVGAATRLARLPRWMTRWLRWAGDPSGTTRIPKAAVVAVAKDIRVDVDAVRTSAWNLERRLAAIVARLPGGR